MELSIRDWMVIVGVLLILAVLLDAWRRIRSEKYSRVTMKLVDPDSLEPGLEGDLDRFKELPNGGARVVERGDILRAARSAPARDRDEEEVELVSGMSSAAPAGEGNDAVLLDGVSGTDDSLVATATPEDVKLPVGVEPEVFMLNVVARSPQGFRGEDILHILLACDLRFGDMNFFHRHEFEAGRGAIQFSVANMLQPGVFDIDNMSDMKTNGLVFFLTLPGPEDMMKAFDYMLETAQAVARNLGGDVLDESRSVLTRQSMEHCRQQIRDLERRMLAKAH